MSERRNIEVELFQYGYSDERMPLADFVAQVNEAFNSVPEELRGTAVFIVDTGYYDSATSMKATYERPETDEEMAKRIDTSKAYAAQREWDERRTFELLKAKFEGS